MTKVETNTSGVDNTITFEGAIDLWTNFENASKKNEEKVFLCLKFLTWVENLLLEKQKNNLEKMMCFLLHLSIRVRDLLKEKHKKMVKLTQLVFSSEEQTQA